MSEQINGLKEKGISGKENSLALGPKDFIFKYLKYLPWLVICSVITFLLAYIKLRYAVPIYRAQSSLLIKDENDNSIGKDQRLDELFMTRQNANLSNEMAILTSTPVLKRVAWNLNLQTVYYNQGSLKSSFLYPKSPFELKFAQLKDSSASFGFQVNVLNDNQFTLNEDKTKYSFGQPFTWGYDQLELVRNKTIGIREYASAKFQVYHMALQEAAEGLQGALKIGLPNDQATILTLTFDNESTSLGVDVLNNLMSVYDSLIIEDKTRIAINTEHFIDSRLSALHYDLDKVEGNLKNDMEHNQTFNVEEQSKKYLDNIGEASKTLIQAEVKIKVVNLLIDYISEKQNSYRLVPTNLGIEEPVLIQLVTEYNRLQLQREDNLRTTKPDNPTIKGLEASIEKIRLDIREALNNVKNAYQLAYNSIQHEGENQKNELRTLPGKSMQLLNIQRQQKILGELYSFLLQKKLESSISSASAISNSKVLEPAKANYSPISPDRRKTYTFYIFLGLLIPIGIITAIEVLKDKVTGRMDVERRTSTPIIGEIGHSEEKKTSLIVTKNSRSIVAEQFRIIRTNLQYVAHKREKTVILVTSSFSGEGKSFISTNMGAVMALSGKKTVIMEFDIRKPKIVSGLDLKRKMGISNYIIGKASFNELLVKVEGVDNLYVIPCGPIPPNPAEILLDKRLDGLMEEVIANFEVVIMDTAPVGLVSDAVSLSRFADCTLYVIRQGYTFRKQVALIDELYNGKKLPSLSILLNDVKMGAGYYGGYGYYGGGYGYGVASGYFEDESSKNGAKNPFKQLSRWWKQLFG